MESILLAILLALPAPSASVTVVTPDSAHHSEVSSDAWVAKKKKKKKRKKKRKKKKAAAAEEPVPEPPAEDAGADSSTDATTTEGSAENAGSETSASEGDAGADGDSADGDGEDGGAEEDVPPDPFADNPYADDGDDDDDLTAAEAATADDDEDDGELPSDVGKISKPMLQEGLLWVPTLPSTPGGQLHAKFDINRSSPGANTVRGLLLTLGGEMTFAEVITVGADLPLLVNTKVSGPLGIGSTSTNDLGNVRLHGRYMLIIPISSRKLILTPNFRLRLPTNTDGARRTVIEPGIAAAMYLGIVSLQLMNGASIFINESPLSNFAIYHIDFSAGSRPISSLRNLEFLAELNILIGINSNNAIGTGSAFFLGFGGRYHFDGGFFAETALRFGLGDPDLLWGNIAWTVAGGWTPDFLN